MPHQHPHSHSHHEPSRHLQWPQAIAPAHSKDVVNPRILDASIHDVAERLSNEQKAEVLIHAMNLLKLANPFSPRIVENGVMSCLQAAELKTPQRVQALLLRGRARMSAGDMAGARDDLRKVLELNPEHAVATSLLSMPSAGANAPSKTRFWTISSASRRLSPEVWRSIASFLPRRDLKTLLSLPHILSRIAFERVFQRVDLTLGAVAISSPSFRSYHDQTEDAEDDDEHMEGDENYQEEGDLAEEDIKLEKTLHRRTADIISRIVMDPAFAKLVKTVRISASVRPTLIRGKGKDHLAFQTTMLLTALPKLVSLQEVIFIGTVDVWNTIAPHLGSTYPRLASLTIGPEFCLDSDANNPETVSLPHLTQLHQFKLTLPASGTPNATPPRSLPTFLAQNRNTLKKVSVSAGALPFSSSTTTAAQNSAAMAAMSASHPFADLLLPTPAPTPATAPLNPLPILLPLAQLTHVSLRAPLVSALDALAGLLTLAMSPSSNGQRGGRGVVGAQLVSLRVACLIVASPNVSSSSGNMNNLLLSSNEVAAVNSCSNALMALATRAQQSNTPAFPRLRQFGFRIEVEANVAAGHGAGGGAIGGSQSVQSPSSIPSSPMSTSSGGGTFGGAMYMGSASGVGAGSGGVGGQGQAGSTAPPLFPSIATFLRTHPKLLRLELLLTGPLSSARRGGRTSSSSRLPSGSPSYSNASSPAPQYASASVRQSPFSHQSQQQQQQHPQTHRHNLGYDASILGLLPSLPALRALTITLTKDVSAGLFSWIIPRNVEALVLSGLEGIRDAGFGFGGVGETGMSFGTNSDCDGEWENVRAFLKTMHQGLPPTLSFLALLDVPGDPPAVLRLPRTRIDAPYSRVSSLMDPPSASASGRARESSFTGETEGMGSPSPVFPTSVKVVRLGGRYYNVRRRSDHLHAGQYNHHGTQSGQTSSRNAAGPSFSSMSLTTPPAPGSSTPSQNPSSPAVVLEEWPVRRANLHAEEWLEALGCGDWALWDDYAPGRYPVPLSPLSVTHGIAMLAGDTDYGIYYPGGAGGGGSAAVSQAPPLPPSSTIASVKMELGAEMGVGKGAKSLHVIP